MSDLGRAHAEIGTLVDRLDVMRWGHAMIRPRPGFLWGAGAEGRRPALSRHSFRQYRLERRGLVGRGVLPRPRAAEEVLAARSVEFKSMLG